MICLCDVLPLAGNQSYKFSFLPAVPITFCFPLLFSYIYFDIFDFLTCRILAHRQYLLRIERKCIMVTWLDALTFIHCSLDWGPVCFHVHIEFNSSIFLLEPWHRRVWKDPYTITLLVSFRLLQTEFRNLRRNFALWWYCLTRLVLSCENPLSFSFDEVMPLIWRYLLEHQVYCLWTRDFHLFISFRNEKNSL